MNRFSAQVISWLFNPGVFVLGLIVAGVLFSDKLASPAKLGWLAAIFALALVGVVILTVAWVRGMVLDADLFTPVDARDRTEILLIFASLILFLLIGSFRAGQPQPLHAVLVVVVVMAVLVAAISRFWKISLHMLGVSLWVTTVCLYDLVHWWPTLIFVPVMAAARLRLARHTPWQLAAGVIVGGLITWLVFRAYHLA